MKDIAKVFLGVVLVLFACFALFVITLTSQLPKTHNSYVASTPVAQGNKLPVKSVEPLKIVKVDSRLADERGDYYDVSWLITVKNETSSTKTFSVRVNFLDKEGFLLDYDFGFFEIPGNTIQDYTDITMLTKENVGKMATIKAELGSY